LPRTATDGSDRREDADEEAEGEGSVGWWPGRDSNRRPAACPS